MKNRIFLFTILCLLGFVYSLSAQPNITKRDTLVKLPHLKPISQANSSSCWSFAATSLFESEHLRIYGDTVDLSEQWFVFWDLLDKAEQFVSTHKINPPIGSELNSVSERLLKYGAVPFVAFQGNKQKGKPYDYDKMYENYLKQIQKQSDSKLFNKSEILKILISTMGNTPQSFMWKGKKYTPKTFYSEVLKINSNDYFSFMSDNRLPYNQRGELIETDNWWHSTDYYNLPAESFVNALKEALIGGYTVALCGDVSEEGYKLNGKSDIFPKYNKAKADSIRGVFRDNGSTTNDHCWHVIGYSIVDGKWWFIVKDSAHHDEQNQYHWLSENYVRWKGMSMMMHKYAARKIVDSIIK